MEKVRPLTRPSLVAKTVEEMTDNSSLRLAMQMPIRSSFECTLVRNKFLDVFSRQLGCILYTMRIIRSVTLILYVHIMQNSDPDRVHADHVIFVLCRHDDASGDVVVRGSRDVDLHSFVSSLRSSSSEHKKIVVYGEVGSFSAAEWRKDLPNVHFHPVRAAIKPIVSVALRRHSYAHKTIDLSQDHLNTVDGFLINAYLFMGVRRGATASLEIKILHK